MTEESPSQLVESGPWAGWRRWTDPVEGTFLDLIGPSYARADGDRRAIVRVETRPEHGNRLGSLHGGYLAAFADHAFFAGLVAMGNDDHACATTVDLTMQYLDSSKPGDVIEARVDLLRETGRLLFLRLTIHQGDRIIASSTATGRKPSPRR